MANLTLAIPDETQHRMRVHREIRWSEVVRDAIEQKLTDLDVLERLTSRSKLTAKDAAEIGKRIDAEIARRLGLVQ
jgi:hypothetical protein